jgi:hypothetical protein
MDRTGPLDLVFEDPEHWFENLTHNDLAALAARFAAGQVIVATRMAALPPPMPVADPNGVREPEVGLITVDEAAERLRRSPKWLYRRSKTLPFVVRLGRSVLIDPRKLAKWLEKQGKARHQA